jgi:hypothetical protein
MLTSAPDQELLARQAALQAEAAQMLAGVDCSPSDVLELLKRLVELPGVVGFSYRDERGERCPTGEARDERYHVPFDLDAGHGRWRIDLSMFLRDLHGHVADWHRRLRDTITDEQRLAVLRIKDVWHRLPSYPDAVSGWEVYPAVLGDGVRTPEQFAGWLAGHGFQVRPRLRWAQDRTDRTYSVPRAMRCTAWSIPWPPSTSSR